MCKDNKAKGKGEDKKGDKQNDACAELSREVECKLNATSENEIALVEAYIKSDPYYVSVDNKDSDNNEEKKTDPTEIERVYFDTLNLSGHRAGIEIRVEHKCRTPNDPKPYKMVVKICNDGDENAVALDRLEESYRMAGPEPDLSVIDDKLVIDALKGAFGVKKLDNIDLYPLVRIMAQRAKYIYSPNGEEGMKIEFDRAVGKGHDFTGYGFDLFQCELEIKSCGKDDMPEDEKNRLMEDVLEKECKRLMAEFSFLSLDKESKPARGFKHLDTELKNQTIRQFAQTHLKPDAFRVFNNLPS